MMYIYAHDDVNHFFTSIYGIFGVGLLFVVYYIFKNLDRPYSGFPIISLDNRNKLWSILLDASDFNLHAEEVLEKGKKVTNGGCYQVKTPSGYKIVVPSRFAHEIRNHPDLNLGQHIRVDLMADYAGFDGVREGLRRDGLMVDVVRMDLTQSLGRITDDLADEASYAVHHWLGNSDEWRTHTIKDVLLDIVARVSTRAFAGRDLARDEPWIEIAKQYTVNSMQGSKELLDRSPILRPIAQWSMPTLKKLRRQVREARILMKSVVEKQLAERRAAVGSSEKFAKAGTAFVWMAERAKQRAPPDFAAGQLMLSVGAIHTTTENVTHCILQLCDNPSIAQALRKEMVQVLRESGWNKACFHKMKLLDSFMKEVQRYHPMSLSTMHRKAEAQVTLSDGTTLPKGSRIMILNDILRDPTIFSEPDKFDAYRFYNMRKLPCEENKHQFTTTAEDALSFGHGRHACPGRFFASNEIKIILCLLLLQYEFRFEPGYSRPGDLIFAGSISANPTIKVQVRARKPEIDPMNPTDGGT
ncbi:Fumitremorgin C monooxygenase [Cercospora beticola]|uniref:Fumitremorgin C monooxygenase n=1 Tax=Cercospora beticola TaxID=122368 RepID=A0A2G5I0I6_CERBT|nr:Fumitremorgin C monooxygenase [Cercospora beticola]PIA98033.1 Fumitremorgin C monooxygenase [Cercospora beticola]WPA99069.1 hypothetical protein RHO25_003684 [Cercospora beticola]